MHARGHNFNTQLQKFAYPIAIVGRNGVILDKIFLLAIFLVVFIFSKYFLAISLNAHYLTSRIFFPL